MDVMLDWLQQTGWKILVIVGFCLGPYLAIRRFAPIAVRRTVWLQMRGKRKVTKEKRAETLSRTITTISAIGLGTLAFFLVLSQLGINITTAIVGMGIMGVAVGFGAQYMIRDYIGGFYILLENQYNIGDVIRVGTIAGLVEKLSIRRTVLRDLDGTRHVISNGEIRIVSNLTREWARAHLNITVAYKEDLDCVMALMRKTWEEMTEDPNWGPFIISKTPWLLRVDEFGSSGITIRMVGETEVGQHWNVMGEYRRRIKRVFDEEGIEIPWPHVKLYYGQAKPASDEKEASKSQ